MRTVVETAVFPVYSLPGARNSAECMSTSRKISPHHSRCNSNSSNEESAWADYVVVPPPSLLPSDASTEEVPEDNRVEQTEDEIDYLTEYICPSDNEDESFHSYDDDCNNDDIFLRNHLTKQQMDYVDRCQDKDYQRSKRSHKKMNAQRQIKTKHAKSIRTKSHNKPLYIHHRLAKKIAFDEPSGHYIPSSQPARLYTLEEIRAIICQHRYGYTPSYLHESAPARKARHVKTHYETYVDESLINPAAYQFREYTLNEFNIPDEPSYDDTMISFLLEMQNRDLSPEDYEMLLRLDERIQRRTVSANVLDTLPTVTADESHGDEQCTICMEKYTLGQALKLLPCAHIFHSNCIETYLKDFSIQCPLDNLPLV